MRGNIRWIGGVLTVLAAAFLGAAAADEKKPPEPGKGDVRAEPYEDAEAAAPLAGGCCGPALVPVCRCEPTTKKKQKTEYEVKCELVCVPGCSSHLCGKRCGGCADGCSGGCCDATPCAHATIRPKKTLLKKVVDEEEDAWEYKVEWVCAGCAAGCCSSGECDAPPRPRAMHVRAWHAFHDAWHGLFRR